MPSAPKLTPGDRVRLISPGARPDRSMLDRIAGVLTGWGLTVEFGAHALDHASWLAGTDAQRLADLNAALRDPGVRAIFASRADGGAYRIADGIDIAAARRDPKPIVGIDGITQLHLALWRGGRIPGVYGALAMGPDDATGQMSADALRRALMTTEPIVLHHRPDEISAAVFAPGRAMGVLVGGNLSAIRGSIGLGLPRLDDTLLLLGDERVIGLGWVDRQLTQLTRSGLLKRVRGIAVGRFTGFDGHVDRGWTLVEVLRDRLIRLGVPVLGGIPVGNGPGALAVPVGTVATLDADAGTLTVEPGVG